MRTSKQAAAEGRRQAAEDKRQKQNKKEGETRFFT
jgi:hypothetical protein